MFENRRWLVIPTEITGSIDFDQVLEYSAENLRLSIDETKAIISYDVNEVTSSYDIVHVNAETAQTVTTTINEGVYGRPSIYSSDFQEYKHNEILSLLQTEDWVNKIEE